MQTQVGMARGAVLVTPGLPLPLGVQDCCDGFNFALFSRHAERVELLLFEDAQSTVPMVTFDLDAAHRNLEEFRPL